jgi:hypothetical protein
MSRWRSDGGDGGREAREHACAEWGVLSRQPYPFDESRP